MVRQEQAPSAAAMLNSLRAIGYSFDTAVADIVDNSIAAGATSIQIFFNTEPAPTVAIVDNGRGMTRATLIEAMRHGASALTERSSADLGRYGLGLKTASLSQCRRLTVGSVIANKFSGARWDLDQVESTDRWLLDILDSADQSARGVLRYLREAISGTVVLWEDLDRAIVGEADPGRALELLMDNCRDHLSLVFHRYLAPEGAIQKLTIAINGLDLQATDPFMSDNKRTQLLPAEKLRLATGLVSVKPYILPHITHVTPAQLRALGGTERLRQNQGFYVYRNRRLIVAGTWFRLIRHDELSKLARVQIDIPNSMDHLWNLDVKKATAHPPEAVRILLRRIIDRIAERSETVFRSRTRRPKTDVTRLWDRLSSREGVTYKLNRGHPAVSEVRHMLPSESQSSLETLLSVIELGLPCNDIYDDMAKDRNLAHESEDARRDLRAQVLSWLKAIGPDPSARSALLTALPQIEPFSMYTAITASLISELSNA